MRWKDNPVPAKQDKAFAYFPHLAEDGYWYWLEWVPVKREYYTYDVFLTWLGDKS